MNVFVTGATGLLGSSLVEALRGRVGSGDRLQLLTRRDLPAAWLADERVVAVRGSLQNLEACAPILAEADFVFHVAANATFGDGADYDADNLVPTQELLALLKGSQRLRNFVFISTIGALDRAPGDHATQPLQTTDAFAPRSAYGKSKMKAEQAVQAGGLPFTIVRPTWIYGRDMRMNSHIAKFVSMVLDGSPALRVSFPGRVSVIAVDDLACGLAALLDTPAAVGKTYFAATESIALGDLMALIETKLHGKRPSQLSLPNLGPLFGALHSKLPITLSNLFVDYLTADGSAFQRDLIRRTPIAIADGIDAVLAGHARLHGSFVITGANSGIGLALARRLHALGKPLVLVDRQVDQLAEFPQDRVIQSDLSKRSAIEALAESLADLRLGALINNAGVGYRRAHEDLSQSELDTTVDVNIRAPAMLTSLLMRQLKRDEALIVNVASSVAYNPLPNMSMYAASKAFVASWSEALSYELRKTNRVLTVSPSGTRTGFQSNAGVKVLREGKGLMTPEAVADEILAAIERRQSILILGASTKILLAVSNFLPRPVNVRFWGLLFGGMR